MDKLLSRWIKVFLSKEKTNLHLILSCSQLAAWSHLFSLPHLHIFSLICLCSCLSSLALPPQGLCSHLVEIPSPHSLYGNVSVNSSKWRNPSSTFPFFLGCYFILHHLLLLLYYSLEPFESKVLYMAELSQNEKLIKNAFFYFLFTTIL